MLGPQGYHRVERGLVAAQRNRGHSVVDGCNPKHVDVSQVLSFGLRVRDPS